MINLCALLLAGNLLTIQQALVAGTSEEEFTLVKREGAVALDDQDCCLSYQFRKSSNDKLAELFFESATHPDFPVPSRTTRITGAKGKWVMEQQNPGYLDITYLVSTDRNKSIPRWVSDPIIHNNLFKTITSLKKLLENK